MTFVKIAGVSIASGVVSVLIAALVLRSLPADYFRRPDRPPSSLWKNLVGWLLVVVGVVMSVPGVPGQGLLTVLSGVILADFPKKMRAERWLMRRATVFRAANAIRRRFHRAPFDPPMEATPHEAVLR